MQIYNYHTITGEFLGTTEADENPLEPGEYIIPASATKLAPEFANSGEVAVFDGQKWGNVIDHRGVEYWLSDGSHHTITQLGMTMPDNAHLEPIDPKSVPARIGAFCDFIKLFTMDEQLKIIAATQSNPMIKLWYDKAMGGPKFSLDHAETALGLEALVGAGLLEKSRMDDVLNAHFN
ncbi:MAG: hypothetical protein JJ858_08075 [Rhizobiaceae bacterium]|nr:hypothetical protein [Rhizobiaceae bacterium]